MANTQEKDNSSIDVWGSIRNLKKKIRGSKTENEITSFLQKSQNSTKFSSNSSMISQKDLNSSQISHREEKKQCLDEQKNRTFDETNYESNYCSGKSISNGDYIDKIQYDEKEHVSNSLNKREQEDYLTMKNENENLKLENKNLQKMIESILKENEIKISNIQKIQHQNYEEKINFYESEVKTLKEVFQRELESKEQEIEMLNTYIMKNKPQQKKTNDKNIIENYENIINMLKTDFQNEIISLKNEHQKQMNEILEEKNILEHILEEKQKEINKLKYLELKLNLMPENKENNPFISNNAPQKNLRKNFNEKNIDNLLAKIKKCMNENLLTESDFNLSSKNNTSQYKNNILMESMGLLTDTLSKLVVAEEFPNVENQENFKNDRNKETDPNVSIEQEELFWMNYSIKNLNEKIHKSKK